MDNLLNLNIKCNWKICTLHYLIMKYDSSPNMSRSAIFERAVQSAESVINWKEIQVLLSELKQDENVELFTNFQVKYSEKIAKILKTVREDIMNQLKDTVKVLQWQYMLASLQLNYLQKLKKEKVSIKSSDNGEEKKVDMPQMAKLLCELMLTDKEAGELQKIKNILIEWKNNKNI